MSTNALLEAEVQRMIALCATNRAWAEMVDRQPAQRGRPRDRHRAYRGPGQFSQLPCRLRDAPAVGGIIVRVASATIAAFHFMHACRDPGRRESLSCRFICRGRQRPAGNQARRVSRLGPESAVVAPAHLARITEERAAVRSLPVVRRSRSRSRNLPFVHLDISAA